MRSPRPSTLARQHTRTRRRLANLERRFITVNDLTETSPVYGSIVRDGGAGTMSITSGAVNATTTLITHNVIDHEVGVDCDIVSSPTRITILTDGLYLIRTEFVDLDNGAGDYGLAVGIGVNATGAVWSPVNVVRRVIGPGGRPQGEYLIPLSAGDYVTQVVGQDSGSTKTFVYLANLVVARIPGSITSADVLSELDGGSP